MRQVPLYAQKMLPLNLIIEFWKKIDVNIIRANKEQFSN